MFIGTSIGSGILAALSVLDESGPINNRNRGGKLILLTDGEEHYRPKINETLPLVSCKFSSKYHSKQLISRMNRASSKRCLYNAHIML